MEALIDQACRDVLPRVYPLPADPFYAAVAKLVILHGGLAKLEHVKAHIAALNRSEGGNGATAVHGRTVELYMLARGPTGSTSTAVLDLVRYGYRHYDLKYTIDLCCGLN